MQAHKTKKTEPPYDSIERLEAVKEFGKSANGRLKLLTMGDPRHIWVRYTLALTAIVALLIASHIVSKIGLQATYDVTQTVNLVDRQRLLSQRILYLTNRYHETQDTKIRQDLDNALAQLETAHIAQSTRNNLPDSLAAAYTSPDGQRLGHLLKEYISLARKVSAEPLSSQSSADDLARINNLGLSTIPNVLDKVTTQTEDLIEQRRTQFTRIEDITLYAALLIILLEGLVIFVPAQRTLNTSLSKINSQNDELRDAYDTMAATASQTKTALDNQTALYKIMRESLSEKPLADILENCLITVLSVPWLQILPKGCIFLTDEDTESLVLTASYDLSPELHTACARIRFGQCLCGRAALEKKTQFSSCIDERHEISFDGISPHGHYNVPILDENGNVLGVLNLYLKHGHKWNGEEVAFLNSVSDVLASLIKRKLAEEETEAARFELSQINQAIDQHCIVAVTDTSGTITHINDKFCEISKYQRDEIIGQNHRLVNSDYHPRSFFKDMYRTITTGQVWHGEIRNRAKDGSIYWVNTSITPVRNTDGAITKYIAIRTDTTAHHNFEQDLLKAHDELTNAAYFDTLTGLPNRAHCQKDMAEYFAPDSPDRKFAMIVIDLDNFKRVNDTLGHDAGDHLLKMITERMGLLARYHDNLRFYRWGGDEFIALVERHDNTDISSICAELTDIISIPVRYKTTTLWPTSSLGAARYPEDADNLDSLMIFSDLALYKTKEMGRDGFHLFTAEMKEKIDNEAHLERELREALHNDELELYYQPQIDSETEAITGIEALIRWNHPQKGLINPGQFLPVAEAHGLAPAIGGKIINIAMQTVKTWVDQDLAFGRLAVNLSPGHLKKKTVLKDFFEAMEHHKVSARYLSVEFLESFIFDDSNTHIMEVLEEFSKHNVHVELDDFGTGYASLSHLTNLPIHGLKIDKSFTNEITRDERRQGIVSSLVSISKLLNLRIVCEGIETAEQYQKISDIGKCSLQGYFIAQPMSLNDITDWIQHERNRGILEKNRSDLSAQSA